MITKPKNQSAVSLGSIKTEKKAIASRINGKRGGRPPKTTPHNTKQINTISA